MIRIIGAVIITLVTTDAGTWCIVIISIVTGSTISSNGSVCSCNQIVVIVIGKSSGTPSRCCCVARCTICRNADRRVIGVAGSIKITLVTTDTGTGCIVISIGMTLYTIVCYSGMCASQRIDGTVIESGRSPGTLSVT